MTIFSSTKKTKNPNYAPGVDGLRTIAVVLVLLFHLGFNFMPGGYVGVDVFFVISGFLITGIIFDSIDKNKFSYTDFMLSRISRLYPALIFTLLIVFLFCSILYSPTDMMQISESAIYASLSASNIFFANSSGYFDNSSEINPLLHTWSLAVEQQFYLVWPFIILISYKINKKITPYVIFLISIISLIGSQWATENMQVEGYYWTPFRIFELALGGVLFFVLKNIKLNTISKEIMMFFGVIIIIFSAITFTPSTLFPGINAMFPVIGALLCIASHDAKYCGVIVNNKFSVGLGLISYSVYLIHWPLIVLYKYWVFRDLTILEKISIFALSFLIAYYMYVHIENKYRKVKLKEISKKSLILYSSLLLSVFLFFISYQYDGFKFRVSKKQFVEITDPKEFHNKYFGGYKYKQGENTLGDKNEKPIAILMGDSFARQLASAIDNDLVEKKQSIIAYFSDGCFVSKEYTRLWSGKPKSECYKTYENAIEKASSYNIPIIYSQRWIGYKEVIGNNKGTQVKFIHDSEYASFISKNIQEISSSINNKVYVISGTNGTGPSGALSCLSRPEISQGKCISNMNTILGNSRVDILNNLILDNVKENKNIIMININNTICHDSICSPLDEDGELLYSDKSHLSKLGADKAWKYIYININN